MGSKSENQDRGKGTKPRLRKLERETPPTPSKPVAKSKPEAHPEPSKRAGKPRVKGPSGVLPKPATENLRKPPKSDPLDNLTNAAIDRGHKRKSANPDPDEPHPATPEILTTHPFYEFINGGACQLKGRKPGILQLPPETYRRFLVLVGCGAYWNQAAQSLGIDEWTVWNWMKKGKEHIESGKWSAYAKFYKDTSAHVAKARVVREIQVGQDNPEFWLSRGPGKSRMGSPGWTDTLKLEGGDEPLKIETNKNEQPNQNNYFIFTEPEIVAQALSHLEEIGINVRAKREAIPTDSRPLPPPGSNGNGHPNGVHK